MEIVACRLTLSDRHSDTHTHTHTRKLHIYDYIIVEFILYRTIHYLLWKQRRRRRQWCCSTHNVDSLWMDVGLKWMQTTAVGWKRGDNNNIVVNCEFYLRKLHLYLSIAWCAEWREVDATVEHAEIYTLALSYSTHTHTQTHIHQTNE